MLPLHGSSSLIPGWGTEILQAVQLGRESGVEGNQNVMKKSILDLFITGCSAFFFFDHTDFSL